MVAPFFTEASCGPQRDSKGSDALQDARRSKNPERGPLAGKSGVVNSSASVLLAEDDEEMRRLLALLLQKEGYRVTECCDGVQLLDHLGSLVLHEDPGEVFDLIISDVRMPGVSGLTVLDGISDRRDFPPVILITAFGDAETHRRARLSGAVALFDKPFNTDQLLSTVRRLLSQ
jgi:CheY-like chemotaxis protein